MGTVHQPEAIAEAVFRAAERAPREYWVGWFTIETMIGNMVSPGLLEIFGRLRDHHERHVRVLQPAVLAALAAIDAGRRGLAAALDARVINPTAA